MPESDTQELTYTVSFLTLFRATHEHTLREI
jgi:hypothetical protein